MTKKLVVRKAKPRNASSMTESAFWSFIRAALRQKSRFWRPITLAKQRSKRVYKGPNRRQKFEYLCKCCLLYFPEKEVTVDHIIPVGKLNCAEDLPGFVERLFCEVEHLQTLCSDCHTNKTKTEKNGTN